MKKRITWYPLFFLLVPLIALFARWTGYSSDVVISIPSEQENSSIAQIVEQYLKQSIPFSRTMRQTVSSFQLAIGNNLQNGVFITENRLMKDIDTPHAQTISSNISAVITLSQSESLENKSLFFTLIPSASSVYSSQLPQYAQPVNQRVLSETVYLQLGDYTDIINTNSVLSQNQNSYIYYRTQDNLTPLGGYYVYSQLVKPMTGLDAYSLDDYKITYFSNQYLGNLYQAAPYGKVQPDLLMTYQLDHLERQFLVRHNGTNYNASYHTLYPTWQTSLGNEMNLYLGGMSSSIQILSDSTQNRTLLVIADETALSWLPFLAGYYKEIMLIDVNQLEQLQTIPDVNHYSQVLVACTPETFSNNVALGAFVQQLTE